MTARPATPEDWRSAVEWLISHGLTGQHQVIGLREGYERTFDVHLMEPDDVPNPRRIAEHLPGTRYPRAVHHLATLATGATMEVYALAEADWPATRDAA